MEPKNVDATLVQDIQEKMSGSAPQPAPVETQQSVEQPITSEVQPEQEVTQEITQPQEAPKEPEKTDSPIDEYGNPVEKPKMYSEEEVQRILRDRLSRGRHAEQQPTQHQAQQAADNFQHDPNSDQSWEVQLEGFIEKTLEKRQARYNEQQWREREVQKQQEFEEKFTTGMNKYNDFHQVIAGKPITDSMMLAARGLDNPAAFIYGACKLHPQEVESIAKINDPYAQAAAVGRLHEKMVKNKIVASNAPPPVTIPKGDMQPKFTNQPSLEERIDAYAKQKRR